METGTEQRRPSRNTAQRHRTVDDSKEMVKTDKEQWSVARTVETGKEQW